MVIAINEYSDIPIYIQIRNQIVLGISDGRLAPGEQLPTVRGLAEEMGVNSMTVNKAYQMLKQEGYIQGDRRCGTVICPRAAAPLPHALRENLLLALSEAKAAGVSEDTVLDLVKEVFP